MVKRKWTSTLPLARLTLLVLNPLRQKLSCETKGTHRKLTLGELAQLSTGITQKQMDNDPRHKLQTGIALVKTKFPETTHNLHRIHLPACLPLLSLAKHCPHKNYEKLRSNLFLSRSTTSLEESTKSEVRTVLLLLHHPIAVVHSHPNPVQELAMLALTVGIARVEVGLIDILKLNRGNGTSRRNMLHLRHVGIVSHMFEVNVENELRHAKQRRKTEIEIGDVIGTVTGRKRETENGTEKETGIGTGGIGETEREIATGETRRIGVTGKAGRNGIQPLEAHRPLRLLWSTNGVYQYDQTRRDIAMVGVERMDLGRGDGVMMR